MHELASGVFAALPGSKQASKDISQRSRLCRAARSSFTAEQCAENVAAVIEGALQHIPRKWNNVQALYLRTAESAALPIYQVSPDVPWHARRAGSATLAAD